MPDRQAYMGDVDPVAGARLWFLDGTGVQEEVEHVVGQSPGGMSWGYAGNGPADTALTILTRATGDRQVAEALQDQFMCEMLVKLPVNERFTLPLADIEGWLTAHGVDGSAERERPRPPSTFDTGEDQDLDRRAADLAARARALDERARRLAEREVRVDAIAVTLGVLPEVEQVTWLPAAPVRSLLEALAVDSGVGIALLAEANGLDPRWAAAVAAGAITKVDLPHVRHVCEALRCTPYDVWGGAGARSISHAYGPDSWPTHTDPLTPVDGGNALSLALGTAWTVPHTPGLPPPTGVGAPELDLDFGPGMGQ